MQANATTSVDTDPSESESAMDTTDNADTRNNLSISSNHMQIADIVDTEEPPACGLSELVGRLTRLESIVAAVAELGKRVDRAENALNILIKDSATPEPTAATRAADVFMPVDNDKFMRTLASLFPSLASTFMDHLRADHLIGFDEYRDIVSHRAPSERAGCFARIVKGTISSERMKPRDVRDILARAAAKANCPHLVDLFGGLTCL